MKATFLILGLVVVFSAAGATSMPSPEGAQEVLEFEHEVLGKCTIGPYGNEEPLRHVLMICQEGMFLYEVAK